MFEVTPQLENIWNEATQSISRPVEQRQVDTNPITMDGQSTQLYRKLDYVKGTLATWKETDNVPNTPVIEDQIAQDEADYQNKVNYQKIEKVQNRLIQTNATNVIPTALLNQISVGEGTSKSGHNTTFAYGKYNPSEAPITSMTLGEIKEFQKGMVANQRGNKLKSSAVGKWQFISKTLKEVQTQMGLPDDAIFNEELQDKMITHRLIKSRGFSKWREGKISDEKFADNLSKEFASIGSPSKGGKSYYGQKVGTPVKSILAALQASK